MRILLDTHVFLWYISADPKLPISIYEAVRDPTNEVHLSAASVWEVVIKHALGKLSLPQAPAEYLPRQRAAHQFASLHIEESDFLDLAGLPLLHRDPFDRLIIAQALRHGLTLATVDDAVRAYAVPLLPAA